MTVETTLPTGRSLSSDKELKDVFLREGSEKTTDTLTSILSQYFRSGWGSGVLFGARPAVSDIPRMGGRYQETQGGSWDVPYDSRCPLAEISPEKQILGV